MTIRKTINEIKRMFPEAKLKAHKVNGEATWFSGFIPFRNKFLYISCSDKRFDSNYRNNILIRTAENRRDFIGGTNRFIDLDYITKEELIDMFW